MLGLGQHVTTFMWVMFCLFQCVVSSPDSCVVIGVPPRDVQVLERMVGDVLDSPPLQAPPSLHGITNAIQELSIRVEELGGEINETLRTLVPSSRISTANALSAAASSHSNQIVRNLRNLTAQTQNILADTIQKEMEALEDLQRSLREKRSSNEKLETILQVFRNSTESKNKGNETEAVNSISDLLEEAENNAIKISETIQKLEEKSRISKKNITSVAEHMRSSLDSLSDDIQNLTMENVRLRTAMGKQSFRPVDCQEVYMAGFRTSGVYGIYPAALRFSAAKQEEDGGRVSVWCVLESQLNYGEAESQRGGWTVILKRDKRFFPAENLYSDKEKKDCRRPRKLSTSSNIVDENDGGGLLSDEESGEKLNFRAGYTKAKINEDNVLIQEAGVETNYSSPEAIHSDGSGRAIYNNYDKTNSSHHHGDNSSPHGIANVNSRRKKKKCSNTNGPSTVTAGGTNKGTNFTRTWREYVVGFGDPHEEYFIGLDALHAMTSLERYSLLMHVWWGDEGSDMSWGIWGSVRVKGLRDKYRLKVARYSPLSTLPDVLAAHHRQRFSTHDSDNDQSDRSCADIFGGGWWFGTCYDAHPTGAWGVNEGERFRGVMVGRWTPLNGKRSFKLPKRIISPATSVMIMIKPEICEH